MKFTFSIHGVPHGSQAWGDISDNDYLKSFYNSVSASNVPTQMIVDIRYSGDTICSYYHYLILSNIDDYESRPGSYFGMTICFEGVFCSDFVELYKLLDACFKKVVLNSVLIKSGDRFKYAFANFDSANDIDALKRVDGVIRKNIPLFEHNMIVFPENFTPKHRDDSWIEKWSIDDVGNKTFVNILLRDSMVSISPFYPVSYKKVEILQGDNRSKDNKIKALESDKGNLLSENEGLKTRISNQEKDIVSKGATIQQKNVVINEQKGVITSLETERTKITNTLNETRRQIERLKEELRQAQNNRDDETLQKCYNTLKDIIQRRDKADRLIADKISPRLKKAEEDIEHIDNQLNKKKTFRFKSYHLLFANLVIVAIIAIAGIVLPTQSSNNEDFSYETVTKSDVQGMINKSLKPINRTLDDINKKVNNINTKDYFGSDLYGDNGFDYDGDEITFIDIEDGGSTLTRGVTYKLTAKKGDVTNRQTLATGGGAFIVKMPNGIEQQLESNDNGITASLHVQSEWSTFTIIYKYNNIEKKSRMIKVAP